MNNDPMGSSMKIFRTYFNQNVKKCATGLACSLLTLLSLQQTSAAAAEVETKQVIDRQGEGRILYSTIKIPANAETLYVSGMGASPLADESWGNMEQQTINIFNKFKTTLE